MLRQNLAIALIYGSIIISVLGCASRAASPLSDISEDMPGDFVARPRFEKPVPRPLDRVLLQWNRIDGAAGYEIQMSAGPEFTVIEKSWTVHGLNLELPAPTEKSRWFRIRSFAAQTRSQWSAPIKIEMSIL